MTKITTLRFFSSLWALCYVLALACFCLLTPRNVQAQQPNSPKSEATLGQYQNHQQQKDAQMDSLLREIIQLKTKLNSELRINSVQMQALEKATDRFSWAVIFLSCLFAILVVSFTLVGWYREKQYHREYQQERNFYEQRAMQYEKHLQEIHDRMLQIFAKHVVISEESMKRPEKSSPIDQVYERRATLIDKKFQQSLQDEERIELETLENMLDKAESPYYESIIQQLTTERDKLTKDSINDRKRVR